MRSIFRHKLFLAIFFSILLLLFLFLCISVYERNTFESDNSIFLWTHSQESEFVTQFAIASTFMGSQTFLLPANIILALLFLFHNKHRSNTWKIALVSLSSAGFLFLIKYIVQRPRPESLFINALHYSFPSGHTFTSITFFGIIVYLSSRYLKNKLLLWVIIIMCILFVLSIAWSRIYLHVHYASDVLAGFCLGIMWLIMAKWFLLERKA